MADENTVLDKIDSLSQAYRAVFGNPIGRKILEDLAAFCRANDSTFHADPRLAANLDGRREVWLRIQKYLNLTPEEILALRFPDNRRQMIEVEKE